GWISVGTEGVIRGAVSAVIVIVAVDLVIATDVEDGAARGIPSNAGGVFLEEAAVVGLALHRWNSDAVHQPESALLGQVSGALRPFAARVECGVGEAGVVQVQAFPHVEALAIAAC